MLGCNLYHLLPSLHYLYLFQFSLFLSASCIAVCFGGVDMGRGPGIAGPDGVSKLPTSVDQVLPSHHGTLVTVIQYLPLYSSSHTITTAAPAHVVRILGFPLPSVIPSCDAPSNIWHSPSPMENTITTASLAQPWLNAVAWLSNFVSLTRIGHRTCVIRVRNLHWLLCIWSSDGWQSPFAPVYFRVGCCGKFKTGCCTFIGRSESSDSSCRSSCSNTKQRNVAFCSPVQILSLGQSLCEWWFMWFVELAM